MRKLTALLSESANKFAKGDPIHASVRAVLSWLQSRQKQDPAKPILIQSLQASSQSRQVSSQTSHVSSQSIQVPFK